MKRYIIFRDKKTAIYLTFLLIFLLIIIIYQSIQWHVQRNDNREFVTEYFIIFCSSISLFVYFKLMKKVVTIIRVNDKYIATGIIALKRIFLKDLIDVRVGDNLEISSKNQLIEIIRYNSKKNIEIYNEIIDVVASNSDSKINSDIIMNRLKSDKLNRAKKQKNKKLKGAVKLLLWLVIIQLISNFTLFIKNVKQLGNNESALVFSVLFFILLLFNLYILYLFKLRDSKTPGLINKYIYIFIGFHTLYTIGELTNKIIKKAIEVYEIEIAILAVAIMILYCITLKRYIRISREVKSTFNI